MNGNRFDSQDRITLSNDQREVVREMERSITSEMGQVGRDISKLEKRLEELKGIKERLKTDPVAVLEERGRRREELAELDQAERLEFLKEE